MNYVHFGRTFHNPNQFEDRILPQDIFIHKYGMPNENGLITIDNEIFSVYMMNQSLGSTIDFIIGFRQNHRKLRYKDVS